MQELLVLYQSKYGFTKKYADMLKEELSCDVLSMKEYQKTILESYDSVIFAGAIYASGIAGMNIMRKNYRDFKGKLIAVFCVGASPFDEEALKQIKMRNLKEDLKHIPLFYGRGGWDESRMSLKDRTLCRILQKAVAKKDPAEYEPWMKALMCSAGKKCDWTDRKYLAPLVHFLQESAE